MPDPGLYYSGHSQSKIPPNRDIDFTKFRKGHWAYFDRNKKPLKNHQNAKYLKWVKE